MKKILYTIILLITFSSFSQNAKRLESYNLKKKVAIQGYDPVTYFKLKKAVLGKKEISFNYEGVIYNFSFKENKETFIKIPAIYEPKYGGWCAYTMGISGEKVDIDPKTFKIIDNKLYLFYNAYFNNTLKSWNKDEKQLKTNADLNWKKI